MVSSSLSLMGLGSKNGEGFFDANLPQAFCVQQQRVQRFDGRFYTRLYEYNVMRQMKDDAVRASEELGNPVFANSGCCSACGMEIENFVSGRCAAYNKCRQMEQALEPAYNRAVMTPPTPKSSRGEEEHATHPWRSLTRIHGDWSRTSLQR